MVHMQSISIFSYCVGFFFSTNVPKITEDLNDKCMSFCGGFFSVPRVHLLVKFFLPSP